LEEGERRLRDEGGRGKGVGEGGEKDGDGDEARKGRARGVAGDEDDEDGLQRKGRCEICFVAGEKGREYAHSEPTRKSSLRTSRTDSPS